MKKGDTIYQILDWDNKGAVAVRKLRLTGFGKKQATAFDLGTGDLLKERISARSYGNLTTLEGAELEAFALAHATELHQKYLAAAQRRLVVDRHNNERDVYIKYSQDRIAELKALGPRVVYRYVKPV